MLIVLDNSIQSRGDKFDCFKVTLWNWCTFSFQLKYFFYRVKISGTFSVHFSLKKSQTAVITLNYNSKSWAMRISFFLPPGATNRRDITQEQGVSAAGAHTVALFYAVRCVYILYVDIYICNVGAAAEQLLYRRCAVFPGGDAWRERD